MPTLRLKTPEPHGDLMSKKQKEVQWAGRGWGWTLAMFLAAATAAPAQQQPPAQPTTQAQTQATSQPSDKASTHITPDQAKQLFALVDELLKFSSQETGLP